MANLQKVLRLQTTVQPDRKISINTPELLPGDHVDVLIIVETPDIQPHSALDILEQAKGPRLFQTAADVDAYLQKERASWDL